MFKLLANSVVALSLMLSASVAAPAWSADKASSSAKCPYATHKHTKGKPIAANSQPARGVTIIERRKLDVQILSFGP